MSDPDKEQQRVLWHVDPAMFHPVKKAGFFQRRIVPLLKATGKSSMIIGIFMYPFVLVFLGLVYGGIVFWPTLVGSFVIVGIVLKRLGYSRNFASWGGFSWKGFAGLFLAFMVALGFYGGLFYLKQWLFALMFSILGIVLAVYLWRKKYQ